MPSISLRKGCDLFKRKGPIIGFEGISTEKPRNRNFENPLAFKLSLGLEEKQFRSTPWKNSVTFVSNRKKR